MLRKRFGKSRNASEIGVIVDDSGVQLVYIYGHVRASARCLLDGVGLMGFATAISRT